jgi:hypothetical protein
MWEGNSSSVWELFYIGLKNPCKSLPT